MAGISFTKWKYRVQVVNIHNPTPLVWNSILFIKSTGAEDSAQIFRDVVKWTLFTSSEVTGYVHTLKKAKIVGINMRIQTVL